MHLLVNKFERKLTNQGFKYLLRRYLEPLCRIVKTEESRRKHNPI